MSQDYCMLSLKMFSSVPITLINFCESDVTLAEFFENRLNHYLQSILPKFNSFWEQFDYLCLACQKQLSFLVRFMVLIMNPHQTFHIEKLSVVS